MAKVFDETGQTDSAIYYAKKALVIAKKGNFLLPYLGATEVLTGIYKSKHIVDSTLK